LLSVGGNCKSSYFHKNANLPAEPFSGKLVDYQIDKYLDKANLKGEISIVFGELD
jgi:hypothetical protein